LGVGTALAAVDLSFGGSIGVILVFTDLIYTAMKYGSDRGVRRLLTIMIAGAALLAGAIFIWHRDNLLLQVLAVQWAIIVTVAAVWGWNVRSERLRTRSAMAAEHAR